MDAAEYKHLVLGLIFVKFISDTFLTKHAELTLRLRDPADITAELEDRDDYREANVFWVPEPARWEALLLIEAENPKLKGILDKRYARDQFPDLRADFILANPPFNISDWWHASLTGDARWLYGDPPAGNANFAWLQHMLHHLAPNGRAGIVLANGSMSSSQNSEGEIRAAARCCSSTRASSPP